MIRGRQLRAARNLLGLLQKDVCKESGLAELTLRKLESDTSKPRPETLDAIVKFYENKGIVFSNDVGLVGTPPRRVEVTLNQAVCSMAG